MNRLFIAIILSLSTLLFSCSDEGSSNSSRGADGAGADASADNVGGTDGADGADGADGESSSDDGSDSGGSIPSGGGAPSGGSVTNPSDEIDARNEGIQQDLNSGSQPDPTTSTGIEPISEPIELEPVEVEDEDSLDSLDN